MRLIDADAIIEVMQKCAENPENKQALLCYLYTQRILEEAPTVEPFAPWHRVEDELPEKEGDYLVWTMLYGGHAYTDYYTPKYGWDEYKVIAWMPLPEPPKEDV